MKKIAAILSVIWMILSVQTVVFAEGETIITMSGEEISVAGSGASVQGSTVTISKGGTYVLEGTLENGQILIEAGKKETVTLRLNGVNVSNDTQPCIYAAQSDKLIIESAEGMENTLQSGVSMPEAIDTAAEGGALQSKDDITIRGEGSLTVYGYLNNGIQTSNDLKIESGAIRVIAVNDGIKGKDSVTIKGGAIRVETLGDAIVTDGDLTIEGGEIDLKTGNGHSEETVHTESFGKGGRMGMGQMPVDMPADMPADIPADMQGGKGRFGKNGENGEIPFGFGNRPGEDRNWNGEQSFEAADEADDGENGTKGLKGKTSIIISGGQITVDAADDALHSDGRIGISGGSLEIWSGDDGIHADEAIDISGGAVEIGYSYEGIEAKKISVSGGMITVNAADDGLNASDGSSSGSKGFAAGKHVNGADMPEILISGGILLINAAVDGLDANGNVVIEGGEIVVTGRDTSFDGALDYDYSAVINGGTLLGLGGSGTGISGNSAQCVFTASFEKTVAAGETLTVRDENGQEIFSAVLPKDITVFVFSAPELELNGTYTVSAGSESISVTQTAQVAGDAAQDMMKGGRFGNMPDMSGRTAPNNGR